MPKRTGPRDQRDAELAGALRAAREQLRLSVPVLAQLVNRRLPSDAGQPLTPAALHKWEQRRRAAPDWRVASALLEVLTDALPPAQRADLRERAALRPRQRPGEPGRAPSADRHLGPYFATLPRLAFAVGQQALAGVFYPWAMCRLWHMFCNMKQAKRYADAVIQQTATLTRHPSEVGALALLDAASALHCRGEFERSQQCADLAAALAKGVLEQAQGQVQLKPYVQRRLQMGWARTLLMQQTLAYYRGDTPRCQALRAQAVPLLEAADDPYGLAKCYHTLSLIAFHAEDWEAAEAWTNRAISEAERIQSIPADLYWVLRDFVYFNRQWWQLQTRCLLYDIRVCRGHAVAQPPAPTAEGKFPPFVPRYAWVDQLGRRPPDVSETMLRDWAEQARQLEFRIYLPDVLISHGDFLQVIHRPVYQARRQYEEAYDVACTYDLAWMKLKAAQRLRGLGAPGSADAWLPPGLARRARQALDPSAGTDRARTSG